MSRLRNAITYFLSYIDLQQMSVEMIFTTGLGLSVDFRSKTCKQIIFNVLCHTSFFFPIYFVYIREYRRYLYFADKLCIIFFSE